MNVVWVLPLLGAVGGVVILAISLFNGKDATQEGAGAALACAAGLLPFILAKSIEGIAGRRSGSKSE